MSVLRVEDPAAVGERAVVDGEPDQLDAETAAAMPVEDVDVREVDEPGVGGVRAKIGELLAADWRSPKP